MPRRAASLTAFEFVFSITDSFLFGGRQRVPPSHRAAPGDDQARNAIPHPEGRGQRQHAGR
jgi:hypothetical protein